MHTTSAYRLVCATLIGSIILILAVASRQENPCAWNAADRPSFICGVVLP
jgi:hypothetical protein